MNYFQVYKGVVLRNLKNNFILANSSIGFSNDFEAFLKK